MAINRRQFLRRTGLVAGGLASSGLFGNPLVRRALADSGDRFVVILFLDGGNDGLNTVSPIDDGAGSLRTDYELHRSTLRLSTAELLPIAADFSTGAQLGLHPGLQGLKNLYDLNKVAVIQGCGYPEHSLSHAASRRVWETGAPLANLADGWAGRSLVLRGYGPLDIPGVTIGNTVAGELFQGGTSILAIRELEDFGFPLDDDYPGDGVAQLAAFQALYAMAGSSEQTRVRYLGNVGAATRVASENYPPAHGLYLADRAAWSQEYTVLGTGTARRLREVAKILYGVRQSVPGIAARIFQLRLGGYDTHADQGAGELGGIHGELHREVAGALELFYSDVTDMGMANQLLVLVWSEFGRRIQQNSSGTDHGSQGPTFVIGGQVNGGVYGNHPNLSTAALDADGNSRYSQAPADPFRSTDFRDVYGTILKRWIGMSEATILTGVLPPDPGTDENQYWVSGNHQFDMSFLPPFAP
jgi:uncharacterized protein (DUF1501 family)